MSRDVSKSWFVLVVLVQQPVGQFKEKNVKNVSVCVTYKPEQQNSTFRLLG